MKHKSHYFYSYHILRSKTDSTRLDFQGRSFAEHQALTAGLLKQQFVNSWTKTSLFKSTSGLSENAPTYDSIIFSLASSSPPIPQHSELLSQSLFPRSIPHTNHSYLLGRTISAHIRKRARRDAYHNGVKESNMVLHYTLHQHNLGVLHGLSAVGWT